MASAIEVKRRPSLGDIKVESRLKGGATEEHAHTQADREHGPGGIDPSSTIFQSLSITLNEAVGSATISPSGRDVCLAARKGLYIVDLDDPWAPPRFLPYYSAIVADVQWSPHPSRAHWVMSTSGEKGLVWNLALQGSASPIEHICLGHERALTDMNWAVFQVDTLATCGIDGNVLVYDLRQGGRSPSARYSGWRYGATQVRDCELLHSWCVSLGLTWTQRRLALRPCHARRSSTTDRTPTSWPARTESTSTSGTTGRARSL